MEMLVLLSAWVFILLPQNTCFNDELFKQIFAEEKVPWRGGLLFRTCFHIRMNCRSLTFPDLCSFSNIFVDNRLILSFVMRLCQFRFDKVTSVFA